MSGTGPTLTERNERTDERVLASPAPHRTEDGRTVVGALESPQTAARARLTAGLVAGFIGGVLMLAVIMPFTYATGAGAGMPAKAVAATWYGLDALIGGASVITVGLLTHFAVAIFFGVVFAYLSSRGLTKGAAAGSALFFGFLVWLFMTYAFLPWANPTLAIRVNAMPAVWFFSHVAFALPLIAVPAMARRFAAQRGRGSYSRHRETRPYVHPGEAVPGSA